MPVTEIFIHNNVSTKRKQVLVSAVKPHWRKLLGLLLSKQLVQHIGPQHYCRLTFPRLLRAFLFWRSYAGMILAVLDYALECFNWEYGRGSALSSVSRLTFHFCHKRQTR